MILLSFFTEKHQVMHSLGLKHIDFQFHGLDPFVLSNSGELINYVIIMYISFIWFLEFFMVHFMMKYDVI